MKKKLLTDAELRAHWHRTRSAVYAVEPGTMLTPAARDFIRENGIQLQYTGAGMTRVPVPLRDGRPMFVDAQTGAAIDHKPEEMTHLSGNRLVSKLHPRIAFRGMLDSLSADILCLQAEAEANGRPELSSALGEVLERVRQILSAEVREAPLPDWTLLGLSDEALRRASHNVRESCGIDHPIPNAGMGRLALGVNRLRTRVREAELCALRAFSDENGACVRPDIVRADIVRADIVRAMNRLSSGVYLIFCRMLAGRLDSRR